MKKKLENFWFYHKTHCILGLLALLVLGDFAWQKLHQPTPDYRAALVAGGYASEQTCARLEETLGQLWAGPEGPARVEVAFYPYDGNAAGAADPSAFMAGGVQLAADLQNGLSVCYFTASPALLEQAGLALQGRVGETSPLWPIEELRGLAVFSTPQNAPLARTALGL